jgi:hypothetical protein
MVGDLLEGDVKELEKYFKSLKFPFDLNPPEYFHWVEIYLFDWHGKGKKRILRKDRKVEFEMNPDWEVWAKPYSISQYARVLKEVVKESRLAGVSYFETDREMISNGFGIRCRIKVGNSKAGVEVNRCAGILKTVCEVVEKRLIEAARENSVSTFFHFPLGVKTSCEQYLLYFVQFLEDLGISANAEIKEDAQRVLFSVTPLDGPSALEQVRKALEIYLKLPGMPEFGNTAESYPNLAVQQLQANILHLQSQLTLAKASMQVKDATIESLQLSNYQYRQLLGSEEKAKNQSETLIGDTIHVTKLEGKGVKVDLPLILKRLKRVFGGCKNE